MNIRCHHHSHLRLGRTGYLGQRQRGSTCPQSHWFGTIRLTLHHQLTRSRNFLLGLSARVLNHVGLYTLLNNWLTPIYYLLFPVEMCKKGSIPRFRASERDSDWKLREMKKEIRLTSGWLSFHFLLSSEPNNNKKTKNKNFFTFSLNINLYLYFWLFSAFYFLIDNHCALFR